MSTLKPVAEKKDILSWDWYEAGNYISADQFIVSVPGWLPSGYGREGANSCFHGGTIFRDAASGIIWVECQVSMGAGETILAKIKCEEWLCEQVAAEIHHLHSDNGVFTADSFWQDCSNKKQSQSFSAVGSQHQNAQAECAIQSIMYMMHTFLIYVSLHWDDRGVDNLSLWSFVVRHAA